MENLLSDAMLMDLYPVCDYWQLITDGSIITINNPIEISYNNAVYLPSEIDKRLIIGKKITSEICSFQQDTLRKERCKKSNLNRD